MSRFLVTGIFLVATGATAVSAFDHLEAAFSDPTARAWALAGFGILKTAVIAAFCFFVAVRDEPRTRSAYPVCANSAIPSLVSRNTVHSSCGFAPSFL